MGRLAGVRGAAKGFSREEGQYPELNYGLAQRQDEIVRGIRRPLQSTGSQDVGNYNFKIDMDLNEEGFQDYNKGLKGGTKWGYLGVD